MTGLLRPPPIADKAVCSEDDQLAAAFLAIASRMLADGGYRAPPPKVPPPVDRSWRPDGNVTGVEPARFSSRHPDMHFAFQTVSPRARGKWFSPSRYYWKGRLQSGLMQRTVETTGDAEFRGVRMVELEPDVTAIFEQPICVSYRQDGRRRRTTPDLYVERGQRGSFIEFKFEEHAALAENEAAFSARGPALAAAGYGYEVITERHIERQPLAGNIERVFRARHQRLSVEHTRSVLRHLSEHGASSITALVEAVGVTEAQLLFLIRHCVVGTDLAASALCGDTVLRARSRGHARVPDGRLLPEAARLC